MMNQSYLFHTRIEKSLCSRRIWSLCLESINPFCSKTGEIYNLSSAPPDYSGKLTQDEIINNLPNSEDGSYLISWRDAKLETMQSFSYFAKFGKLSFRFSKKIIIAPLDDFGSSVAELLPISNLIVQESGYLDTLKDFHVPNKTNLHLAPGHSNGRDGYVEGVSAEMWFGESFWQFAKCTKNDLLSQDWLHCEQRPNHLYVRAWPEPFSSAEGEQGEIQRQLLDLLFGINGKTPPPLPLQSQSTFVQKVLIDGEKLRDLGMKEVRPDGSRSQISPPAPPPSASAS